MNEQRLPAEVFCLAEHLYDEMVARGWTTEKVAVRMHTKHGAAMDLFCLDLMMCVQDENLILDDDLFNGLGRAFGVDPQTFRNIHEGWLKHPDRRSPFEVPEEIFGPTSRRTMIRVVHLCVVLRHNGEGKCQSSNVLGSGGRSRAGTRRSSHDRGRGASQWADHPAALISRNSTNQRRRKWLKGKTSLR